MSRSGFRVNPHSIVAWMSKNSLLDEDEKSEGEVTATGLEPRTTSFLNEQSTIWPNWPNDPAVFWVLICTVQLTVCSYHVTYTFQSEYTLCSFLNIKELLLKGGAKSEGYVTATGLEPRTTSFLMEHSTIWSNWPNDRAVFRVLICTVHLTLCFCHVTYALQSLH